MTQILGKKTTLLKNGQPSGFNLTQNNEFSRVSLFFHVFEKISNRFHVTNQYQRPVDLQTCLYAKELKKSSFNYIIMTEHIPRIELLSSTSAIFKSNAFSLTIISIVEYAQLVSI